MTHFFLFFHSTKTPADAIFGAKPNTGLVLVLSGFSKPNEKPWRIPTLYNLHFLSQHLYQTNCSQINHFLNVFLIHSSIVYLDHARPCQTLSFHGILELAAYKTSAQRCGSGSGSKLDPY